MLDDPMLIDRAGEIIRTARVNAETALHRTLEEISALFDRGGDPYLRERRGDVSDVVGRLCANLRAGGDPLDIFKELEGPLVLVADELTPSVIAQLDWHRLAALVSDEGSWTYHTAILARSIRVPAVAGLRNASSIITPGSLVAVDGSTGEVVVGPDDSTVAKVRARNEQRDQIRGVARHVPPAARRDRRRSADPARSQYRVAGGRRPHQGVRRRRHRAVPLRVPAGRERAGGAGGRSPVRGVQPSACGTPRRHR